MHFEYSKTSKQLTQNTNEFRVHRLRSMELHGDIFRKWEMTSAYKRRDAY